MHLVEAFPWLSASWRQLTAYLESGRIPQALLITGSSGVGKRQLAQGFAQRLLCRQPGEFACGICPSCLLLSAGNHPDLLKVEPEETGKPITVDAIRNLIEHLALKSQYDGHRCVILEPAQRMNRSAANSLLKTLEEPGERTSLLLLSDSPEELPATILSRCQRLHIATPEPAAALEWLSPRKPGKPAEVLLALAQGAPLRALELDDEALIRQRQDFFSAWRELASNRGDPVQMAEQWQKVSCETLTEWLASWTIDLIRLSADHAGVARNNPDLAEPLQAMARRLNLTKLFRYLDLVHASKKALAGQANRQLVLEELLIRWSQWSTNP